MEVMRGPVRGIFGKTSLHQSTKWRRAVPWPLQTSQKQLFVSMSSCDIRSFCGRIACLLPSGLGKMWSGLVWLASVQSLLPHDPPPEIVPNMVFIDKTCNDENQSYIHSLKDVCSFLLYGMHQQHAFQVICFVSCLMQEMQFGRMENRRKLGFSSF